MNFFRHQDRHVHQLWVLMLSLSILFSQGAWLHVHDVFTEAHTERQHLNGLHPSHDESHGEHHLGGVTEIDVTPEGMQQTLFGKLPPLVLLLLAVLVFPVFVLLTGIFVRPEKAEPPCWRYLLSPPLRAPPL